MRPLTPHEHFSPEDDRAERHEALDVRRSFIVQAPAGSGKTELLIQRYLALLATVSRPELILAMTFTRKAADEMRERIIKAIDDAKRETATHTDHEKATRQLALAVLQQDQRHQWNLVDHPSRLRVLTFDAYCSEIVRQTPMVNGWGIAPTTEDPDNTPARWMRCIHESLYEGEDVELDAWKILLSTFENSVSLVSNYLCALLMRRDQWLNLFYSRQLTELKINHEDDLNRHIEKRLYGVYVALKDRVSEDVLEVFRCAGDHLSEKNPDISEALLYCAEEGRGLPEPNVQQLKYWRLLLDWLLTQKGTPRKAFNVQQGLPPDQKKHKEIIEQWTSSLDEKTTRHLSLLQKLPENLNDAYSWEIIHAIFNLLKRIYARYRFSCVNDGVTDYTETQLAALNALATDDDDTPSDLLLKLDRRIDHILIDEFQDTSTTQAEFLGRLVSGWEPGDGRTFFAVGDPMQSIYRFRQAEVRVFLEAQQTRSFGNSVTLTPLTLKQNFRSQANIVSWCNSVFTKMFPDENDLASGAVKFEPAIPVRPASAHAVEVNIFGADDEEADYCAKLVARLLKETDGNIAILIRQRNHLKNIIPALREQGIAFTATEIDALGGAPVINDLMMLTRTLLQPDDDIAWLSVLRAPFCGLTLADITALSRARTSNDATAHLNWYGFLSEHPLMTVPDLSAGGQQRLATLMGHWRHAKDAMKSTRLSLLVSDLWIALRAPSFYSLLVDRVAADTFFEVLETADTNDTYHDWTQLVRTFNHMKLPGVEESPESARVRIMTIHKAKGLQFDAVIIPHLNGTTKGESATLLRWKRVYDPALTDQPDTFNKETFLLAVTPPDKADRASSIEAYIKAQDHEEIQNETIRLLYVALTRAKNQLFLTGVLNADSNHETKGKKKTIKSQDTEQETLTWKNAISGSLLALLQEPLVALNRFPRPTQANLPSDDSRTGVTQQVFQRLTDEAFDSSAPHFEPTLHENHHPLNQLLFDPDAFTSRQIGTLVHRALSRVGIPEGETILDWTQARLNQHRALFARQLVALGIPKQGLEAAVKRVITALTAIYQDTEHHWIFDASHQDAQNELALTIAAEPRQYSLKRIDRTFIREGVRYIIDYKITQPESPNLNLEAWLDNEVNLYRDQLRGYARMFQRREAGSVKALLYFPLVQRLVNVDVEG
ncbi:MAG: UvrD-helicase domain-containing protein [Burkholderiales bacterium]|jgi:ATP-dependent exoDNAse (exonuclease V) beta subunit|nr:UvrD-helicase domain-containing protein [Burkholderiales bacterium]